MSRSLHWLGGLNAASWLVPSGLLLLAAALGGCDQALGLGEYMIPPPVPAADGGVLTCSSHADCQVVAAADSGAPAPDHCYAGRCVSLRSLDCETVTGPANDKRALLIGSLFSTSGAQRQTNMARQQSAMLAVEEINAAGGVRLPAAGDLRPLAMVSCDAGRDLSRAARHLITDLGVNAIVGPNTSQDTLDLASQISIESRTLLLSPTAQASSIADLLDHDLSWVMVPSDLQRAPLLLTRIRGLEAQLHAERTGRPLRLGVVLRDDVLAQGARAALSSLDWNGEPITRGDNLRIDSYAPSGAEIAALVTEYAKFAPDVIVLVGTAETVSQFMAPLERAWKASERAHYVVTDSSKIPDLLALVRDDADLRTRVTGIGVQPTPEAAPNQAAFARAYLRRYGEDQGSTFGTGQAYDAVYALALAYTRVAHAPARGDELAFGLRGLYGGASTFALQAPNLEAAQATLLTGRPIRALGSFAPLRWDERGALVEGSVEVFCLAAESGEPFFKSSGLSYDVGSGETLGEFKCQGGAHATQPAETAKAAVPASACGADCAADAGAGSSSDSSPPMPASAPGEAPQPSAPAMDAAVDGGMSQPFVRNLACGSAAPCGVNASEYCCVSGPTNLTSCETEPRPCTYEFRCSRDADCRGDEQCCQTEGRARCIPANQACPGARFGCTSARDCPTGNQCCSHLNRDQTGYAATRCEASCDAAQNSSALCDVPLDCAPGMVCRVSNYLPNLNVCDALIR